MATLQISLTPAWVALWLRWDNTALLIRVVTTVVVPITLPVFMHADSVSTQLTWVAVRDGIFKAKSELHYILWEIKNHTHFKVVNIIWLIDSNVSGVQNLKKKKKAIYRRYIFLLASILKVLNFYISYANTGNFMLFFFITEKLEKMHCSVFQGFCKLADAFKNLHSCIEASKFILVLAAKLTD